jgi:hypothetical protein
MRQLAMAIDKIRRASSSSAARSNPSFDRVSKKARKKKQPDDIWERYKDLLLTLWLEYDKPMWFVGDFMRTNYQVDLRSVLAQLDSSRSRRHAANKMAE